MGRRIRKGEIMEDSDIGMGGRAIVWREKIAKFYREDIEEVTE
jgi:hypothetical protein